MIRQDIDIEGYWKVIVVYDVELGDKNTGFTLNSFHISQTSVLLIPLFSNAYLGSN